MKKWLYVAAEEHIYLEPIPHIFSPGDIADAITNPDPARFVEL